MQPRHCFTYSSHRMLRTSAVASSGVSLNRRHAAAQRFLAARKSSLPAGKLTPGPSGAGASPESMDECLGSGAGMVVGGTAAATVRWWATRGAMVGSWAIAGRSCDSAAGGVTSYRRGPMGWMIGQLGHVSMMQRAVSSS